MTLNTSVWLTGPIHGEQAFDLALRAILTAAEKMDRYETAIIEREKIGKIPDWVQSQVGQTHRLTGKVLDQEWANFWRSTCDRIRTQIGQGLPAITDCAYRADGSPLAPEDVWVDADGESYIDQHACAVELSWDTAYGYKDRHGGCSILHARALVILSDSLPEGVSMRWMDEYSGAIHGDVTPETLKDFFGAEADAQALAGIVQLIASARGGKS